MGGGGRPEGLDVGQRLGPVLRLQQAACHKLLRHLPRCRPGLGEGGPCGARECRDVPADWPSFEAVFREPHRVMAKVPVGARAQWAECLTHAIKHVAFFNDARAWAQFLALPKLLLGQPSSRGGANKNKGGPTKEVADRCRKWLEGERASR